YRHGGIGDPRVDEARLLQIEERGGVVAVAEDVAGGLVDRHGARARRRVGPLSRMEAQRREAWEPGVRHGESPSRINGGFTIHESAMRNGWRPSPSEQKKSRSRGAAPIEDAQNSDEARRAVRRCEQP